MTDIQILLIAVENSIFTYSKVNALWKIKNKTEWFFISKLVYVIVQFNIDNRDYATQNLHLISKKLIRISKRKNYEIYNRHRYMYIFFHFWYRGQQWSLSLWERNNFWGRNERAHHCMVAWAHKKWAGMTNWLSYCTVLNNACMVAV